MFFDDFILFKIINLDQNIFKKLRKNFAQLLENYIIQDLNYKKIVKICAEKAV